ncbi:hypothetical protein [Virgisporangium aurantiacum]|uniref:Uncharacterized protein n=1 Tax=Virgisporangium aurantiacum TaxID=175570 RepID=A0A8J3ZII8_9ACTN|nr:hypothetical protein [Virgisporangium aurantiacum]GIJ63423.1 hypothetical protein Vau01_109390 [Virgisporangium aurantiacum]
MTDNLLREALQRQADRAPDPDRVRAALPRRAARRTRRRYGSLAGGLVAAAALAAFAVPVLALDDAPAPRGAGPAAEMSSSASAGPAAPAAVGLRYRPTWLPAGLTERSRSVPLGPDFGYDGPVRFWKRSDAGAGFDMGGSRLEFGAVDAENGADQFGDYGQAVDINGRPGRLSPAPGDGKSSLHWLIDPQTVIFIHNVEAGVSDADLLRIARSVQPDPGQVAVPMRFGWLPTGMAPKLAQFAGDSADRWQLELTAYGKIPGASPPPTSEKDVKEGGQDPDRGIYARLGRSTDAPDGGESITVAGRPARIVIRDIEGPKPMPFQHVYVVVELASGLKLTVSSVLPDVSRDDLLATAAAIEVGPGPDLGWLGVTTR